MKRYFFCCCVVALASPAWVSGQEVIEKWDQVGHDDDYQAHFGAESSARKSAVGPTTLEEARAQGRGITLGGGTVSARPASGSSTHTVADGETLWGICSAELGDPWQWPRVWSYNPEITNPHWIYPGTAIRMTANASTPVNAMDMSERPLNASNVTDATTRVVIVRDSALQPGSVFLRDQGYLDNDALKSVGTIVGAPEEHLMLGLSDQAYVKFNEGSVVRPGDEFAVFRRLEDRERYPTERGVLVKIAGTALVRSYDTDKRMARVLITESIGVIERGFRLAQVARRFDLVPPAANQADVVAHIIASTEPHGLLAEGDVVFLDVGESSGVLPGNRFFVVRRGDSYLEGIKGREHIFGSLSRPPIYRPQDMPKEVVAELRVVKVRKDTTIALITRSDTDLTYGDVAEMRQGY